MKNRSLFAYLAVAVLTLFLVMGFTGYGTSMAQQNLQEGLVVTVEVFSGRPNPSFIITDTSEITRLRENLGKLPALATAGGEFSEFGRLGYRGIIISNLVGIEGIPKYVQVLEGKVKVCSGTKGANFFEDVEGMEKYYLGLAKDRGVIPADLFDRNIVPDPDAM